MKKIFFVSVFALFFFFGVAVRGENKQKLNWDNIKIALAALPSAYITEITIHEGSHAIAAKSFGAKITGFSIFPSLRDGRLYFGYVDSKLPYAPTSRQIAWVAISPKIANICLFSVTEVIFRSGLLESDSRLGAIIFILGEFAPWIDFTAGIVSSLDMSRFESATGLRPSFTRTIGAVVSVVGLYFLFERAKKIFWHSRRGKTSERFGVSVAEGGTLLFGGKF